MFHEAIISISSVAPVPLAFDWSPLVHSLTLGRLKSPFIVTLSPNKRTSSIAANKLIVSAAEQHGVCTEQIISSCNQAIAK